ncbi:MAG TPA: tetratricopeptide repeat protein, partial [Kofleriaceae bacterium]|nr:tetratricopeptide repeat protein [Kofleriaceae bacterium]
LLATWGDGWELGYRDACEATRLRGEQSEHLLDLRMQCLSRRLDTANVTLQLLGSGGSDAIDHAVDTALALPSLAPCADRAALLADVAPPETAAVAFQVASVRSQLDMARGMRLLGRYQASLDTATAAVAAARAAGYGPAIAEGLIAVGAAQLGTSDVRAADTLREAMLVATRSGATVSEITAAAYLVYALTTDTNRFDAAHEIGAIAEAVAAHAPPPTEAALMLDNNIALLDVERGKLDDARARYLRALARGEQELPPGHPQIVATLDRLGLLAKQQGKFAEAVRYAERAVAARELAVGKDHPELAAVLNNLAIADRAAGKLDDAKRLYDRVLAIRIAALGPDHPDVASAYTNLGNFYADRDDMTDALAAYRKALAILEAHYGKDAIQLTTTLNDLGTALQQAGEPEDARAALERSIAITEKAYGPEYAGLPAQLSNLALVDQDQGRLDDAQHLLERALAVSIKINGPDHPDTADYLANLGVVAKRRHDFAQAQALYARALAADEKAYGPEHPRTAMTLVNLAQVQSVTHDDRTAIASLQRALAILDKHDPSNGLMTSYAASDLGDALCRAHRAKEALPLYQRALAIRTSLKETRLAAETRYGLALAQYETHDVAKAREQARTALAEFTKAGDAQDADEVRRWLARH